MDLFGQHLNQQVPLLVEAVQCLFPECPILAAFAVYVRALSASSDTQALTQLLIGDEWLPHLDALGHPETPDETLLQNDSILLFQMMNLRHLWPLLDDEVPEDRECKTIFWEHVRQLLSLIRVTKAVGDRAKAFTGKAYDVMQIMANDGMLNKNLGPQDVFAYIAAKVGSKELNINLDQLVNLKDTAGMRKMAATMGMALPAEDDDETQETSELSEDKMKACLSHLNSSLAQFGIEGDTSDLASSMLPGLMAQQQQEEKVSAEVVYDLD